MPRLTDPRHRQAPPIRPGSSVSVLEYVEAPRYPAPGDQSPVVVGRIEREYVAHEGTARWVLTLLPNMQAVPDFLVLSNGRRVTQATTAAQAQRVLDRACEALSRYLDSLDRLKQSVMREIDSACGQYGAVQDGLPLGDDEGMPGDDPAPLRQPRTLVEATAEHLREEASGTLGDLADHLSQEHADVAIPDALTYDQAVALHREAHAR